jgi:hypothetical protein
MVELEGHHTKAPTFMMAGDSMSFTLVYCWENERDGTVITVRDRILLYLSPGGMGTDHVHLPRLRPAGEAPCSTGARYRVC